MAESKIKSHNTIHQYLNSRIGTTKEGLGPILDDLIDESLTEHINRHSNPDGAANWVASLDRSIRRKSDPPDHCWSFRLIGWISSASLQHDIAIWRGSRPDRRQTVGVGGRICNVDYRSIATLGFFDHHRARGRHSRWRDCFSIDRTTLRH